LQVCAKSNNLSLLKYFNTSGKFCEFCKKQNLSQCLVYSDGLSITQPFVCVKREIWEGGGSWSVEGKQVGNFGLERL
jgi:hypothetical protein